MNYLGSISATALLFLALTAEAQLSKNPYYSHTDTKMLSVSDAEWKKVLSPGVYQIAREKATEQAYTGDYWDNHKKGTYYCGVCGYPLFSSTAKFDSHTGWPSFYQAIKGNSVKYITDESYGMSRTEVACARCGSHLGHVFDDGPAPTHKRYCMNGDVLDFEQAK
jgi:peptide-methionine (R)-S-oxide reductase